MYTNKVKTFDIKSCEYINITKYLNSIWNSILHCFICRSENVKVDIYKYFSNNETIKIFVLFKIGESRFNNYDSKVVGKS